MRKLFLKNSRVEVELGSHGGRCNRQNRCEGGMTVENRISPAEMDH